MTSALDIGRYLRALAVTFGACLVTASAVNVAVDAYGVFGWVPTVPVTASKAHPGSNIVAVKLIQAADSDADVLIAGNSRAQIGLDPSHPELRRLGRSTYNFAIPGAGIQRVTNGLRSVFNQRPVGAIVMAVDFPDFVVDARHVNDPREPPVDDIAIARIRERAKAAFTMTGLLDTMRTLRAATLEYPETLRSDGFYPALSYVPIVRRSGARSMFQQRLDETAARYIQADLALYPAGESDSQEFAAYRRAIALALEKKCSLRILTYPYHAEYLLLFREMGIFDEFETWKRQLVDSIDVATRGRSDAPLVELWDFAIVSGPTGLDVGDGNAPGAEQWYWEAGHFKKELGDRVLARMLQERIGPDDAALGERLTKSNIEDWLARQRGSLEAYAVAHPGTLTAVREAIRKAAEHGGSQRNSER
jgi:hypothetical protein